jgi:integrase/recombinase XerD
VLSLKSSDITGNSWGLPFAHGDLTPFATTATHLLHAGVDINTIRAWLGHVSLDTTNIYAEIDLETKARALALCEVQHGKRAKRWHHDKGLMAFLRAL